MARKFHLSVLVAASAFGAVICASSIMGATLTKGNVLHGYWEHRRQQDRSTNVYQICLRKDGSVEGTSIDNGHGWDWSARWVTIEQNKLSLAFDVDEKIACKFSLADDARLSLSECSQSGYPEEFMRIEDTSPKSDERRSDKEKSSMNDVSGVAQIKSSERDFRGCWS